MFEPVDIEAVAGKLSDSPYEGTAASKSGYITISDPTKRMEKILDAPFVRRDAPVVGDEGRREQIARIIDPYCWDEGRTGDNSLLAEAREKAFAKADAILSLSTPVMEAAQERKNA